MNVKAAIEQQIAHWEHLGHPALMERFVLRHGREGKAQPCPDTVRKGVKKECFKNAADHAILHKNPKKRKDAFTYVEGYGINPKTFGMLIHHAWVEDPKGNVIDNTWDDPQDCFYFGVPFKTVELCEQLVKHGTYGILDLGVGLNHELMFSRDPSLETIVTRVMRAHLNRVELLKAIRKEA